jgi:hypothetical protein
VSQRIRRASATAKELSALALTREVSEVEDSNDVEGTITKGTQGMVTGSSERDQKRYSASLAMEELRMSEDDG